MTKVFSVASALGLAIGLGMTAGAAMAAPVEIHLAAGPYECDRQQVVSEWRLRGDSAGQIMIEGFQRRDGGRFVGQQWQVSAADLANPLDLLGQNNHPAWRIAGLLDGQPVIQPFDRNGAVHVDCHPDFVVVPAAGDRYAAALALLDTPEPTPEVAAKVDPTLDTLPPLAFLPELEQRTTTNALRDKQMAFWKRFKTTSVASAGDTTDAQLLLGIEALLVATTTTDQKRLQSEILVAAITARIAALIAAGTDPRATALLDEAGVCARLDINPGRSWDELLLIGAGLPVDYWDEAFANRYLGLAAGCKMSRGFTDTLTHHWPLIQKRNASLARLAQEAARLAGLELNSAIIQAENWLQLASNTVSDYRREGVRDEEIRAVLEPVLAAQREKAVPILAAELAQDAHADRFDEMPGHCTARARELTGQLHTVSVLLDALPGCQAIVFEQYQAAGLARIAAQRDAYMAQEPTVKALIETGFFAISPVLPRHVQLPKAFQPAQAAFVAAADATTAELAAYLDAAVPTLAAELAQGADTDRLDEMPGHCTARLRDLTGGARVPQALHDAVAGCQTTLAEQYRTEGLARIAAQREALTTQEPTVEALYQTNLFTITPAAAGQTRLPEAFQPAQAAFTAAIDAAEADLAPLRNTAIELAVTEINAAFAKVDPLIPDDTADTHCGQVIRNLDPRAAALRTACQTNIATLRTRQQEARCNAVWADMKAPKGFREGRITLPFEHGSVSVEELVCSPDFKNAGLKIEDNSGLFRSEFLLTRTEVVGGTPVRFAAVLTKPSGASDEWSLSKPQLNDTPLSGPQFKTSADFLGCAITLEACFRQQ